MKEPILARVLSRVSSWFPVLLLAGLAMLTYWLDAQVQRGGRAPASGPKPADYYLEDFAATRFGKDGSVIQKLAAKKLTHYPEGVATDVIAPELVNTQPGAAPLRVRANTGSLSPDNEHIYLQGDVVGVRDAMPGRSKLTIRTQYLHVTPRNEQAETDKRVTITDDNGTHTGGSLQADNKARVIRLRNGVTGEIVAHPKP
jgi:lipopolysaccharide export system protein LptC